MADAVYLRTNRFEVKLEGIATKTRDFESLCKMDFLFPNGKVRVRPPIVGLDVMNHPRDPKILLVLLCFGIGCVILRFNVGEPLPTSIHKFLSDNRIHFVGFGVPEKKDLFPFEELGLSKSKVDIGYIASRVLKDSKYKKWELSELARKVLGIKKMIALTDESSLVRHEQIKCAICQLFITSVIGIKLLGANNDWDTNKKKNKIVSTLSEASLKKGMNFLKNLNSLRFLSESWFKLPIGKKKKKHRVEEIDDCTIDEKTETLMNPKCMELLALGDYFIPDEKVEGEAKTRSPPPKGEVDNSAPNLVLEEAGNKVDLSDDVDDRFNDEGKDADEEGGGEGDDENGEREEDNKDYSRKKITRCDVTTCYIKTKPLKGILKCPSSNMLRTDSFMSSLPDSPPPTPNDQAGVRGSLRRANSKGCNVSFKCDELAFS